MKTVWREEKERDGQNRILGTYLIVEICLLISGEINAALRRARHH